MTITAQWNTKLFKCMNNGANITRVHNSFNSKCLFPTIQSLNVTSQIGESFEQCAIREAKEETNLDIENMKLFHVTNNPNMDNDPQKHYITIFMKVIRSFFCTHTTL